MRYPRNAKIFRGQLDAGPFMAVFFLLLLFVVMASMLYMPGIPIYLGGRESVGRTLQVTVLSGNKIAFKGKELDWPAFQAEIEAEIKLRKNIARIAAATAPDAAPELIGNVRELARKNRLEFDAAGSALHLPSGTGWQGTTNPTLTVALNAGSQLFYQNQLVQPGDLQRKLADAVAREKQPITLIVLADQSAEQKMVAKLAEIAREAQIDTLILAMRPAGFQKQPSKF